MCARTQRRVRALGRRGGGGGGRGRKEGPGRWEVGHSSGSEAVCSECLIVLS